MPDRGDMPYEVDFTMPNVARMYDYYLGGKDNYAADREAARLVLGAAPDVPLAALENREFLKRAVQFLAAERGIRQFVDIGPGLPTQGNVHQLAQRHNPGAKVAYIDNDASVLVHSRELLHGDARRHHHPRRPAGTGPYPGRPGTGRPHRLLAAGRAVHDPGSPLRSPGRRPLRRWWPGSGTRFARAASWSSPTSRATAAKPGMLAGVGAYDNANAPLIMRTRSQIQDSLTASSLIEPGVVFLSQWRPAGEYHAQGGTRWGYCGVGEKP